MPIEAQTATAESARHRIQTRKCSRCRRDLPMGQFGKDRCRPDGVQASCKQCHRQMSRAHYRKHREDYLARVARQEPIKIWARRLVKAALGMGLMTKGPCEECGSSDVEGHHDDYLEPFDVRWLCRSDHNQYHVDHGEALYARAPVPDAWRERGFARRTLEAHHE